MGFFGGCGTLANSSTSSTRAVSNKVVDSKRSANADVARRAEALPLPTLGGG